MKLNLFAPLLDALQTMGARARMPHSDHSTTKSNHSGPYMVSQSQANNCHRYLRITICSTVESEAWLAADHSQNVGPELGIYISGTKMVFKYLPIFSTKTLSNGPPNVDREGGQPETAWFFQSFNMHLFSRRQTSGFQSSKLFQ